MRHKLPIGCAGGVAGALIALVPVTAAMGQDQPLGLLVVGLGFIVGPLALLVPAALVACGAAAGAVVALVVGFVAARISGK